MSKVTLHILIASINRSNLQKLLLTLKRDLKYFRDDKITVVFDGISIPEWTNNFKWVEFLEVEKTGRFGHPIRTMYQNHSTCNYIHNMDDDDTYTEGWRHKVDEIIDRKGYPDFICFNSNSVYKEHINCQTRENGVYVPFTGNVISKHIPSITTKKWGLRSGDDMVRFNELFSTHEVIYSDFALINKHRR